MANRDEWGRVQGKTSAACSPIAPDRRGCDPALRVTVSADPNGAVGSITATDVVAATVGEMPLTNPCREISAIGITRAGDATGFVFNKGDVHAGARVSGVANAHIVIGRSLAVRYAAVGVFAA